jgi:hypothetical protein
MRCLHCKQRLNVFKSLTGSSFCSQEHKKLYEAGQANTAFERLLEFVEQDAKPSPGKAKPSSPAAKPSRQPAQHAPLAPPETQKVAGNAERASDPGPEPPVAGFLLEPIAPPVLSASSEVNAKFEILESSFPPPAPALPSFKIEIAPTDLQNLASEPPEEKPAVAAEEKPAVLAEEKPAVAADASPPPLASLFSPSLAAIDAPMASMELPSVGPVRPRAIDPAAPSPQNCPPVLSAPPVLFSSDPRGLQPSVHAAVDTPGFSNLARLNPLQREPRTASEQVQTSSVKTGVPTLSQPDAVELSVLPQAKLGRDDSDVSWTVDMNDALTLGGNVSALPAHSPQPRGSLGVSAVRGPILAGVQDVSGFSQPLVFPARVKYHASAMHWPAPRFAGAYLPPAVFANLKIAQGDSPAAMAMNGSVTRVGVARAVRQPQTPSSRLANALGSSETLNQVFADVQIGPVPEAYAISSAQPAQPECVTPLVESTAPESAAGLAPLVTPTNVTIRESDTAAAAGITEVTKPAPVSGPLSVPDVPASRRSVAIGISRTVRKVPAQIQAKDGSRDCAILPARPARLDCLLPAILRSIETWLRSAVASVGWFHESDCPGQAFPSAGSATRLFSIRFAPESVQMDVPAIACDRTVRRVALDVCEGKSELAKSELEAQRLARARPSGSSPLSLVALPRPGLVPLAVRYVANLNQFTSVANPAKPGAIPPGAASASADDHNPTITLPQFAGSGLSLASRLSSQAAFNSPPIGPSDQRDGGAGSHPRPSPVRVQPASMLVLPGSSIPVRRLRWVVSRRWATVVSPSLPKQDHVQSSSSEDGSLPSLPALADVLRVDPAVTRVSAILRLNPRRPPISLEIGAQPPACGVPAANALPRRRGPKLPVVRPQLDGPIAHR